MAVLEPLRGLAALALTLMVFSYLLGDNPLYRLAVYTFVGASAGYAVLIAFRQVLWPLIIQPVMAASGPRELAGVLLPVAIGSSLLLMYLPRGSALGNWGIAFLVGVGAAVALVGALTGTLFPQVLAAGSVSLLPGGGLGAWLNGLITFVGALTALLYFQFIARRRHTGEVERPLPLRLVAAIGQGFIVTALGAFYAGALLPSLAVLSGTLLGMRTLLSGG